MNVNHVLKSNVFENFLSLSVIQGLNYLLPLITIPFLFNQLGVEKYGLTNFSFAFVQYFVVLTDFGFGLSGTRYVASHRDDLKAVNRFLCSATISRLIMATLSFGIMVGVVLCTSSFKGHELFSLLFFGIVVGNVINPTWFFQGMERMKFNTLLYTITRSVSILPLFVLIREESDYMWIPICYSLGAIIAGIFSLLLVRTMFGMKFFWTSLIEVKSVTIDSSRYFLSRVSNSLYTNTNSFVIGLVCGNAAVGYYSLAEKIYMALSSIYGPINGALFPYMTKKKDLNLIKKVITWGAILNLIFIAVFYYLFPFVWPLFFNEFSEQSMNVLNILLISSLIGLPSTFMGYPFLAAFGHPNFTNYSLVFTSIFHITGLLVIYLLFQINIQSVAFMVLLSDTMLLTVRLAGVYKYNLWR